MSRGMGRRSSFTVGSSVLAIVAALVAACGGSSSSDILASTNDGGTTPSGEAGADAGASGGAKYTLDDVCDLTAPKICELRKSCCEKAFGYDESACLQYAKNDCAKDVADARAGLLTFHPERIDPCVDKYQKVLDLCYETVDVLFAAFTLADCRIFEGQLAAGAQCARDSQCAAPTTPNSVVGCDDTKQTCNVVRLFKEGDACTWADPSPGFCDKGTYCDAPIGQAGAQGTCKKATPLGEACNTTVPITMECGLGAYCDKTTGKCSPSKDTGAKCETAFECQSLKCEGTLSKTCQQAKPLVKEVECK